MFMEGFDRIRVFLIRIWHWNSIILDICKEVLSHFDKSNERFFKEKPPSNYLQNSNLYWKVKSYFWGLSKRLTSTSYGFDALLIFIESLLFAVLQRISLLWWLMVYFLWKIFFFYDALKALKAKYMVNMIANSA